MMAWDKTKDELRQETARTASKKKKTAKWCKGKVGVEHVTEIVVNHNYSGRMRVCEWRPIYYRKTGIVQVWKWHYSCVHAEQCVNCGKYVEWSVAPEKCPNYIPREDESETDKGNG